MSTLEESRRAIELAYRNRTDLLADLVEAGTLHPECREALAPWIRSARLPNQPTKGSFKMVRAWCYVVELEHTTTRNQAIKTAAKKFGVKENALANVVAGHRSDVNRARDLAKFADSQMTSDGDAA
jgi:hypothetical protein